MANRSATAPPGGPERRAKRLSAEARRASILEAARRAFSRTGDMNGTTIRVIADEAGISEGVIYRHFESKDQLFFEAVVEPLRSAVDDLVAASAVENDEPLDTEVELATHSGLYRRLISTLEEVLPLLGLVLFGDPEVAERFYRENFAAAMERLTDAWQEVGKRHEFDVESPELAARAVMGTALMLALDGRYQGKLDRDEAIAGVADGLTNGFFPPIGR